MTAKATSNDRKFAEPRSWAGKWCGFGLTGSESGSAQSNRKEGRFAEPRGWSVKWCSRGLFKGTER